MRGEYTTPRHSNCDGPVWPTMSTLQYPGGFHVHYSPDKQEAKKPTSYSSGGFSRLCRYQHTGPRILAVNLPWKSIRFHSKEPLLKSN